MAEVVEPRAASRAVPQDPPPAAPRPRQARQGGGDSGPRVRAACASVRVGLRMMIDPPCARQRVPLWQERGGLRVTERAWEDARVCLCALITVVCGWGGSCARARSVLPKPGGSPNRSGSQRTRVCTQEGVCLWVGAPALPQGPFLERLPWGPGHLGVVMAARLCPHGPRPAFTH